ncbi:MAG: cache domain-containing protein [Desulfobacterales bacterium]|nr:cache domain-containing protein [Desulfobacterales bacterium]
MFSSILYRRICFVIFFTVLCYAVTIYIFSVPLINKTVYSREEEAAKTIMDNMAEFVKSKHFGLEIYRASALNARKKELKHIIQIQENFIKAKYNQYKTGNLTESEAKYQALEILRTFKYGNNDYVWISSYDSVLISHPDPKLHNADFSQVKDIDGNLIVPPMVRVARENGEGYTFYWWKRLEEEKPIEKITYSRHFPQWEWVMATGVYIDDVEADINSLKEKMINELRQMVHTIKIARTGYMYIFDANMNMIMHPNPNIENTDFSSLLNPVTNKSIGRELMAAAKTPEGKLYYKWDKPDDKGHYIYDKISWVIYNKELGWYIVSSVYTEELNSSAIMLRNMIFSISVVMFLLFIGVAIIFVNRILVPVKKLSDMAVRVKNGDLSAQCDVTGKDEFGMLAVTFNGMVNQIKSHIKELDSKVQERTRELDKKNEKLLKEIAERNRMELETKKANEKLTIWVNELKQHNHEMFLLNQMGDMLQACHAIEETYGVIAETFEGLFPGEAGSLFFLKNSGNLLESAVAWGNYSDDDIFQREHCWGLRRGKVHQVVMPGSGQVCQHVKATPPFGSLCIPLVGKNEVLGMLHLRFAGYDPDLSEEENRRLLESKQHLVMTVADHLSLSLANLKLRDRLQELSIRDPLTELYNRRFMQESLEREIRTAQRDNSNVGILMIDVDHFKVFNDNYGHEAGDVVLRELGAYFRKNFRGGDIACRFGGEEFTIIMPRTSLENAHKRAEKLCFGIKNELSVKYLNKNYNITISVGVAIFPVNGSNSKDLLVAADTALYRAKNAGRNQVVIAEIIK